LTSPSNSGFAPLLISGCNSSPCPFASTLAFNDSSVFDAGDWFIWGLGRDEDSGAMCFGWLNAPVDAFCRRSNSSCSLGGRRGGAGPVAKAGRVEEFEKRRRDGKRNLGSKSRDIVYVVF